MKNILLSALLAVGLAGPAAAQSGVALRVISPGFTYNAGIVQFAAGFEAVAVSAQNLRGRALGRHIQFRAR